MKDTTVQVGPGFLTLLALLFIGLKLGGVIGWSWWWVLAPLWVPAALVAALVGAAILAAFAIVYFTGD